MAEVELGRIAVQNASSDQVRKFGQRMIDDHGKANDELKSLAGNKDVTVPSELDHKHAKEVKHMQTLSGKEFDRAYMKMMVADHEKDVSEFKQESQKGKDGDVKGFAKKTLPTLKEHLSLARQTRNAVVGTSGKTNGSRVSNKSDGSKRAARASKDTAADTDASGATEAQRNRDSTTAGQQRKVGARVPVHSNPPPAANVPSTAGANGSDASSGDAAARNRDSTVPAQQGEKQ